MLYYEGCAWLSPLPGAVGFLLRRLFWSRLFGSCGKTVLFRKMGDAVAAFRGRRLALASAMGISILFQLNVVTFYFLIGSSMSFEIPYYNFLLIVPLEIFIMLVPVSSVRLVFVRVLSCFFSPPLASIMHRASHMHG